MDFFRKFQWKFSSDLEFRWRTELRGFPRRLASLARAATERPSRLQVIIPPSFSAVTRSGPRDSTRLLLLKLVNPGTRTDPMRVDVDPGRHVQRLTSGVARGADGGPPQAPRRHRPSNFIIIIFFFSIL
jgi:hypothetical protein